MTAGDDRASDEATGLPPLHIIDPENTLVVVAWDASEGITYRTEGGRSVDAGVPVHYLHARGVSLGPDGTEWAQVHLAVTVAEAADVAVAIATGAQAPMTPPADRARAQIAALGDMLADMPMPDGPVRHEWNRKSTLADLAVLHLEALRRLVGQWEAAP